MGKYRTIRDHTGPYGGNTGPIWDHTGPYWAILDQYRTIPYGTMKDHTGQFRTNTEQIQDRYGTILDHTVPYWIIRDRTIWNHTRPFKTIWAIQDHMGPYRTIWGHSGPYGTIYGTHFAKSLYVSVFVIFQLIQLLMGGKRENNDKIVATYIDRSCQLMDGSACRGNKQISEVASGELLVKLSGRGGGLVVTSLLIYLACTTLLTWHSVLIINKHKICA